MSLSTCPNTSVLALTFAVFNSIRSFFFPASLLVATAALDNANDLFSSPSFFLASSTADGSAWLRRSSLRRAVWCAISSWTDAEDDIDRAYAKSLAGGDL